jgi:hypothetical protein
VFSFDDTGLHGTLGRRSDRGAGHDRRPTRRIGAAMSVELRIHTTGHLTIPPGFSPNEKASSRSPSVPTWITPLAGSRQPRPLGRCAGGSEPWGHSLPTTPQFEAGARGPSPRRAFATRQGRCHEDNERLSLRWRSGQGRWGRTERDPAHHPGVELGERHPLCRTAVSR